MRDRIEQLSFDYILELKKWIRARKIGRDETTFIHESIKLFNKLVVDIEDITDIGKERILTLIRNEMIIADVLSVHKIVIDSDNIFI